MHNFKQIIFQRKNSIKEMYFKKKNTVFQHKVLQPKQIHFCERQTSTKFINFVPAIYLKKKTQNLILLLSKIDDLPKKAALNSKVMFLQ